MNITIYIPTRWPTVSVTISTQNNRPCLFSISNGLIWLVITWYCSKYQLWRQCSAAESCSSSSQSRASTVQVRHRDVELSSVIHTTSTYIIISPTLCNKHNNKRRENRTKGRPHPIVWVCYACGPSVSIYIQGTVRFDLPQPRVSGSPDTNFTSPCDWGSLRLGWFYPLYSWWRGYRNPGAPNSIASAWHSLGRSL